MIKEEAKRKNVPEVRFEGFEGEWERKKLGDAFNFLPNNTLSRANLNYNVGLALNVHYGDVLIKFGETLHIDKDIVPFITDNDIANKLLPSKLQSGDIIFADTAEDETVGKCTELINVNNKVVYAGLHTIPVRPTSEFGEGYLGYFLNAPAYHDQLLKLIQGIKVLAISKTAIKDTLVHFPKDKTEQSQIGTLFHQLDNQISHQRTKLQKLQQVKQAMLTKMFPQDGAKVPEVRFEGFEGDWEEKKLGEIAGQTFGGGTPQTSIKEYWGDPIPWFQSSDFTDGIVLDVKIDKRITNKGLQNSAAKLVPANSIAIITRVGVGKLAFIPFKYSTSQDVFSLSYLKVEPIFATYSCYIRINSELNAVQGTSIKGITKEELLAKTIFIPTSYNEQSQIGSFFQQLDTLLAQHQKQLDKLGQIKSALLDKLFV